MRLIATGVACAAMAATGVAASVQAVAQEAGKPESCLTTFTKGQSATGVLQRTSLGWPNHVDGAAYYLVLDQRLCVRNNDDLVHITKLRVSDVGARPLLGQRVRVTGQIVTTSVSYYPLDPTLPQLLLIGPEGPKVVTTP